MNSELTKSFCLRPTTVFVLFYFNTWLPRRLVLTFNTCRVRDSIFNVFSIFLIMDKNMFFSYFYSHIDVFYNYGFRRQTD